jgi:hypothetical protein
VACGVVNASGAVGDLWMTLIALRYPARSRMMDERDGMRVFLPKSDTHADGSAGELNTLERQRLPHTAS